MLHGRRGRRSGAAPTRNDVALSPRTDSPRPTARLWPLFAGGFLGPFGGGIVTPMLPELAHGLHTSVSVAAWSLTAYMIPFAAIMVVSGTLAERWGRARTVRLAFVVYAASSLACAVAPTASLFLAGRAVQGAANAFTTPLLLAAISDLVAPAALGRALGKFGGWQAAGQAFAPLIGGLAAAADYRYAFAASTLAAAVLAGYAPADRAADRATRAPGATAAGNGDRWRALANRRLVLACAVAFGVFLTTSGLLLLAALFSGDRFGIGPVGRGVVVAAFGVAGLVGGPAVGRVMDARGTRAVGIAVLTALGVGVAVAGLAPNVAVLVAVVALCGASSTGGRLLANTLALGSTPANRAGATSMTLAWQFLGSAIAPQAWLPVYHHDPALGMLCASVGAFGSAALLVAVRPAWLRAPASSPPGAARPGPRDGPP